MQVPGASPRLAGASPGFLSRVVERARATSERLAAASPLGRRPAESGVPFSQEQIDSLGAIITSAVSDAVDKRMASLSDATVKPKPASTIGGTDTGTDVARRDVTEEPEYVPDLGDANLHARPVFVGGDTLSRPQRYNMHRDATFDLLGTKPKGTLFKMYCTMEPSLRYLYNAKQYASEHCAAAEAGEIDPDEFVLHLERLHNTISGVYDMLNREVSLIQLRAKYGDNPSAREKAKLEHIEDVLTEEDFLPAGLDERILHFAVRKSGGEHAARAYARAVRLHSERHLAPADFGALGHPAASRGKVDWTLAAQGRCEWGCRRWRHPRPHLPHGWVVDPEQGGA